MVIDPYAKMDDDLDPTPSSSSSSASSASSSSSTSSSSSSTTYEAGTKHGNKQGRRNESELHLSGGVSRDAGGHIKRGLFSEDEDDDTEEEEEDDDDNAFTDALSDNIEAGAGSDAGAGELCSSSPALCHAVEAARAATSSSSSSSPAPPTVREVEVILRKFKATLADHAAACFASEQQQQQQHDRMSSTTPLSKGARPADTLDTVEERLLTLMTSLPPLNPSPLLECVTMVEYVELTGRPSRGDGSSDDVAALVIRNSVIFSASFHKKILQLLESHIQKMKANLNTGKDVEDSVFSSVPLMEELEREVTFRSSLLSGYSTFREKDRDFSSNTTTTNTTSMTQHNQERLSALCKLNTSRAEAMCWLQSAHKRSPSPTPGESPPRPSNSSPSPSSISFTLFRALHTAAESDLKVREAYGKTRGSIMLEREREEAVRPTIGCTLNRMLSAQSAASWTMAIPGPPTLRFTSTTTSRPIDCMNASPSTRAAVVQFLVAPLVGVDSDVFGLQGFTSALEFAGLTCPSMLLLILPCVVARLELSTEEELTSTLLRDVSLSPFQRYHHSLPILG
jgi:hypothetical protein